MNRLRSSTRTLAQAAIACAALAVNPAVAQSAAQSAYPEKPVNILIPFAAGGAMDAVARPLADAYAKAHGQSWIIEHLGGAGGTIATTRAVRAPADGYNLLFASNGQVSIAPFVYPSLAYDPSRDLVPVVHLIDSAAVLYAATNSPYHTVADVIQAGKNAAESVSFAHAGNGSLSHLALALLEKQTGARFVAIPYKGAGVAIRDLGGATVPLLFTHVSTARGMVEAGRVRPLAVAAEARLASLPDVPTFSEAGVPDFIVKLWVGLMAPAGTPQPHVDTLATQVNQVLQQPAMRERLAPQGFEVVGGTAQQFRSMIARDTGQWRELSKTVNLAIQ